MTLASAAASAAASPGATSSAASPTHLRHGAGGRRDHRHARGHRLERRKAEALVQGRERERRLRREAATPLAVVEVPEANHATPRRPTPPLRRRRRAPPNRRARRRRARDRHGRGRAPRRPSTSVGRSLRGSTAPSASTYGAERGAVRSGRRLGRGRPAAELVDPCGMTRTRSRVDAEQLDHLVADEARGHVDERATSHRPCAPARG